MIDFDELKNNFFVSDSDSTGASEPTPDTFINSLLTPIIDAEDYNSQIEDALNLVGNGTPEDPLDNSGQYILIANWWLGLLEGRYKPPENAFSFFEDTEVDETYSNSYFLDGPGGSNRLIDILINKARAGVDVRVLGWVSFALMGSTIAIVSGAPGIARLNSFTMNSIKELRSEPKLQKKAILNTIGHTAGGVHAKMVVIGNKEESIGFTGGIDFQMFRWADPTHELGEEWHDIAVKIEGPAVQGLFDYFRLMWNENLSRKAKKFKFEDEKISSYLHGSPTLDSKVLPINPKGNHHVQNLRTIPQFNYFWYNCLPENSPPSSFPNGAFEVKLAWRKAILAAEQYIYIEDQSFWSKEIFTWLNQAIKNRENLRIILVTSGKPDPNDPEFPTNQYWHNAINNGLLTDLTPVQRSRIGLFKRWGETPDTPYKSFEITNVQEVGPTRILITTNATSEIPIKQDFFSGAGFSVRVDDDYYLIVGNDPSNAGEVIRFLVEVPTLFALSNLASFYSGESTNSWISISNPWRDCSF